jgi:hypothetical protein
MEDFATLFAAVGAAASAGVTLLAASWSARRSRQLDARSQAGQVFAHLGRTVAGEAVWVVENRSDSDVHDVCLTAAEQQVTFETLSPGEVRVAADAAAVERIEFEHPVVTFRDAAGHHWEVSKNGLQQTNKQKDQPRFTQSLTASAALTAIAAVVALISSLIIYLDRR